MGCVQNSTRVVRCQFLSFLLKIRVPLQSMFHVVHWAVVQFPGCRFPLSSVLFLLLLFVVLSVVPVPRCRAGFFPWPVLSSGCFLPVVLFLLALLSGCLVSLPLFLARAAGFSGRGAFPLSRRAWFAGPVPSLLPQFRRARSGSLSQCGLALLPCVRLRSGFPPGRGHGLLWLLLPVPAALVLFSVRVGAGLLPPGRVFPLLGRGGGFAPLSQSLVNNFHFFKGSFNGSFNFHSFNNRCLLGSFKIVRCSVSKKFKSISQLSLFLSSKSLQSKLYWFAVSGRSSSVFEQSGTKFVFQRANGSFKLYNNNNHVFVTIPENFNV